MGCFELTCQFVIAIVQKVGYCQGSAFVIALLLLRMPEEEAFSMFQELMEQYGMP